MPGDAAAVSSLAARTPVLAIAAARQRAAERGVARPWPTTWRGVGPRREAWGVVIAEGLWGIAVPLAAALVALAAVKLTRSARFTLVWLGTFAAACAIAAFLISRLVALSTPLFAFAVLGNALCILMLYALITRSISFDLLAVVASHPASGVTAAALLAGDPLNVRGRLAQLMRRGFVREQDGRFRITPAGAFVARVLIGPLYRVRRNEP